METNALAGSAVVPTPSDQAQNDQSLELAPEAQVLDPNAPQGTEEPDGKSETETTDEKPNAEAKKAARTASERIAQLQRERNEAEIRAHVAEQKLRGLKRPIPVRENMTDLQRQAVELRQAERDVEAEETVESLQEARTEARSARFTLFSEKVGSPEIVDAFCKLPRVSEELADLVAESDKAKELAAWLSKNPSEARRLSTLPPHRLGAELARKEGTFTQPTVRRVSQAPEPSTTLKGGSNPPAFDPASGSIEALQAMLKKQRVLR
jgi:hypothetical protein